jgi:hypothetical protein
MKLCRESISLSAASMKARMAEEGTPCDSGVLRGRPIPRQREVKQAVRLAIKPVLMFMDSMD